ncbi:hypothetical protein [Heyndrickxia acidicola]|uniref:Uncharacterized protein n=1 Tax=Heyndrickxia acidicola TaxID=209389 RepID=A0ABU6MSF4_9BACI|nr:hypothetical protein [Heyndrickxia acidicola]MED1205965.1 hypothetical protein [Heyndrickxia acidicola]
MNQDIELTMFINELHRLQEELKKVRSESLKKELQKDIRLFMEVIEEVKIRMQETT